MRVDHGITALGIIAIFLALHLANHLTFILGRDTYRAVMKAMRNVYRQGFSATAVDCTVPVSARQRCTSLRTPTSYRWTVSAPFRSLPAFFLAAYVLGHGHMNSVFVFARLYLGTRWIFQASLTDPDGAPAKAQSLSMPHYGLGVSFGFSHLAAGARVSHGVARLYADRFLIGGATAAGLVAFAIIFDAAPGLTSPYPDPR
jgi:hypothetical protein